ncbi:hypothetical protein Tco_1241463 [Tanacetum coccineum]
MGSSENDDSEMSYQYRGEMSSGSMFNNKSSSGSGNLFGSGWDPLQNFDNADGVVERRWSESGEDEVELEKMNVGGRLKDVLKIKRDNI